MTLQEELILILHFLKQYITNCITALSIDTAIIIKARNTFVDIYNNNG